MQALNYHDLYRRAFMSVKHHVIMTADGTVEPLQPLAVDDAHAFIGHRLPDEIYFYQSRGIIGSRVLSWRASGEVIEPPPLDGGESITYQMLVRDQLVPQRLQTLSLLSYSLARFYQHNNVALRCWFDLNQSKILSVSDSTDPKTPIADWNVRLDAITARASALKVRYCDA